MTDLGQLERFLVALLGAWDLAGLVDGGASVTVYQGVASTTARALLRDADVADATAELIGACGELPGAKRVDEATATRLVWATRRWMADRVAR